MLHEASSIFKAIEKAWEQSGKPEIFSIKILEQGKQGFLWFGGRPAIVSITYDPKQQSLRSTQNKPHNNQRQQERKQQPQAHSQQRPSQSLRTPQQPVKHEPLRTVGITPKEKTSTPARQELRTKNTLTPNLANNPVHHQSLQEQSIWTQELADQVTTWLQEFATIITGSQVPFTVTMENKNLHIAFAQGLLDNKENEKNLFMSFAYLLIQALKKKCKKKLRGFHLLITSPASHRDVESI